MSKWQVSEWYQHQFSNLISPQVSPVIWPMPHSHSGYFTVAQPTTSRDHTKLNIYFIVDILANGSNHKCIFSYWSFKLQITNKNTAPIGSTAKSCQGGTGILNNLYLLVFLIFVVTLNRFKPWDATQTQNCDKITYLESWPLQSTFLFWALKKTIC